MPVLSITSRTASCRAPPSEAKSFWYSTRTMAVRFGSNDTDGLLRWRRASRLRRWCRRPRVGWSSHGHEQAPAHVFLGLRMQVPEAHELRANVLRQPSDAGSVDLDEVAGRVTDVELHDVPWQLDEVVAEGRPVEGAAPRRRTVRRLEVVDGDR